MAAALPAGMFVISSVVAYRRERSFARFKQARLPGGGRFVGACGGGKPPTGIAVTNSGYIVTNSAGSCKMQLQMRLTYYMPK